MSVLDEIMPTKKYLVIDLVSGAGLDVSDWANFAGGPKRASMNPKYCYEWSFVDSGRLVVLNLWHASMREKRGIVSIELNARESVGRHAHGSSKPVWRQRADRLDLALQAAARDGLPIRAIVNDGRMRDADDPDLKASRVTRRLLDPVPWAIESYDWNTGKCTLRRGPVDHRLVDQFSLTSASDSPAERRPVSGQAYVRDAAVRLRVLERARGRCEYCGSPGFATADGRVFLETHHVIPLSEDGPDAENNVAALCPNHHREAHHGALAREIRESLLRRLASARTASPGRRDRRNRTRPVNRA